jgi:putative membrane protein insertion efficiency factor
MKKEKCRMQKAGRAMGPAFLHYSFETVNPVQHILIFAVRVYRWTLSPAKIFLFGPLGQCRFEPSCSAYAIEALKKHGAVFGSWLAMKRICRCHPWGGCGEDPVPPVGRVTPCAPQTDAISHDALAVTRSTLLAGSRSH